MKWSPIVTEIENLSQQDFFSLVSGEVPCIVVENFYPEEYCHNLAKVMIDKGYELWSRPGGTLVTTYPGLIASDMLEDKQGYFDSLVPESNQQRSEILKDKLDPLKLLTEKVFNQMWSAGTTIASDEEKPYFAGLIMICKKIALHTDWCPKNMQEWSIGKISQQLSWNVMLQAPEEGGDFQIWQRYWQEEDETVYKYDPITNKGYKREVVDNCLSITLKPKLGSLTLYDARNYHEIHEIKGTKDRIAMVSFAGILDESNPLILWS